MIVGRYGNTTNAPYVEARVVLPRLKIAIKSPPPGEADISFLADTGADRTVLMPLDLTRMAISETQLINPMQTTGVSGQGCCYREDAIVTFVESGKALRVYNIELLIMEPKPDILMVPSLLGRDIMSNWAMTMDRPGKRFHARVVKADHTFKLSSKATGLTPLPGVSPPLLRT